MSCDRLEPRHCEPMSLIPAAWSPIFNDAQHAHILLGVIASAVIITFLSLGDTVVQRLLPSVAVGASTTALAPLLVSPAYLSDGLWTWGLALVGASAMVGTCAMHAVRAALGCVLSSRLEWALWVLAVGCVWVAMIMSGAYPWAMATVVTACALYAAGAFLLPHYLTSTTRSDEVIKGSILLSLPVALTGVPWLGVPVLVGALIFGLLGRRGGSAPARYASARSGVVTSHALAASLPAVLLAVGASSLPAAMS